MTSQYILIAEDDPNILAGLVDTLESEGYQTAAASDGNQALALVRTSRFDLVLLDIMMPGKSGFDVCRAIRKDNPDLPVIMVTARGEEIDKVLGLELGADDYITKPFGVRELLARVAAVLRRAGRGSASRDSAAAPDLFRIGCAQIDALRFKAVTDLKTSDLSQREVRLLQYFHEHPDEVLSRDKLLNAVWGVGYFGTTRTLDQHVAQLRKKIEPDPQHPRYITTVHGVGYRYCTIQDKDPA